MTPDLERIQVKAREMLNFTVENAKLLLMHTKIVPTDSCQCLLSEHVLLSLTILKEQIIKSLQIFEVVWEQLC